MKIKRFIAPDMRTALQQVRQEHGSDAVILSNRMTEHGIEIVAASDYDQEDVLQLLTDSTAAEARCADDHASDNSITRPIMAASAPTNVSPLHRLAAPASDAASIHPLTAGAAATVSSITHLRPLAATAMHQSADELPQLRVELARMRQMLERQMHHLTDTRLRGSPVRQQVMEWMEEAGFDAGITRDLTLQIPADLDWQEGREQMFRLLSQSLPLCPDDLLLENRVIALIGPAGAGKTTTLAKLAAQYSTRHSAQDVVLITTDTQRIGGDDLLCRYGRHLGIAVHSMDVGTDLGAVLQRLRDDTLVLMDTAGLAHRDRTLAGQLNWLRGARQVCPLLVLPANTHPVDLEDAVRRFQPVNPQGVILTKVDESQRLGSALSVLIDRQLPLAWISDGQRLHDDLHRADASSVLLSLNDPQWPDQTAPAADFSPAVQPLAA